MTKSRIPPLPEIMVAPNGARRGKQDHPALPVSIEEVVQATLASHQAGADGVHAHVRTIGGDHTLDVGLYRELIAEFENVMPGFYVQITTEAVGRYSPEQQRQVVRKLEPKAVSVSIAEMLSEGETAQTVEFYQWAHNTKIALQHILYSLEDLNRLTGLVQREKIPDADLQCLFVLGRYAVNQQSEPKDVAELMAALGATELDVDCAFCAFGQAETDCLVAAKLAGAKARIGFENSIWHRDGSIALDNADRIREFVSVAGIS